MSMDCTDPAGGSLVAGIYSLQGNLLVRLALERPVVSVDLLFSDAPVGLDGANHMPLLPAAEIDQFG